MNNTTDVAERTMPDLFRQALDRISGGRVLDVATAQGGFVGILIDNLRGYTEIIGFDVDEEALQTARATFGQDNLRFVQMDAEHLGFVDQSFDTVNVSASLHHLENVPQVLAEMVRVLKPGGHLIVSEMHSSGQSEAQLTAIYVHQWVAAVDVALGLGHYSTLARQDILDRVGGLGAVRRGLVRFLGYRFRCDGTCTDPAIGRAYRYHH
jgi:ubiquinone/menaquinone biosynthesis C-methylase UbiE